MEILPSYRAVSTPSRRVAAAEEIERLERIFDRLSDDHREVILLSRVLGLPGRDVAEQMGRTETATRSLLLRALAALADEIESEERAPRGTNG
jgi:RNA polymerase sigma factor (sigma-70 family)